MSRRKIDTDVRNTDASQRLPTSGSSCYCSVPAVLKDSKAHLAYPDREAAITEASYRVHRCLSFIILSIVRPFPSWARSSRSMYDWNPWLSWTPSLFSPLFYMCRYGVPSRRTHPSMPPRYATTSAYQAIFIVFLLFPCTLSAPSGGSSDSAHADANADANAIIVVITVFSLVIILPLGALLAYRFPSLLPAISRRFCQAAAHMNHSSSAKVHHKLKARFFEIGRISNEAPTTPASPAPRYSSTQSTPVEVESHEISLPLSILFENHSAPTSNQRSVTLESQAPDTPGASTESIPREAEGNVDAPNTLAVTRTENQDGFSLVTNATQFPSGMNRDDTLPHDHPPVLEEETPLPQSPAPSTRPPTYYTDASRDSMYTLPLYQENEENQPRRTWSTRSRSSTTARGHQNRSLPRPPLLLPPSSYPAKKRM